MAAHRAIDVPIEHLPFIDEHSAEIDAPADVTWEALMPALQETLGGRFASVTARRLGCEETETSGDLAHPGGTFPGFVVSREIPPVLLAMQGEHRFSSYAVIFKIDLLGPERSRIRMQTRAEFPGRKGRVYRGLVIGTRGHVIAVHKILRRVKREAERIEADAAVPA